ncbi:MAG: SUMF1/EgtB/PvdO family nonheme iron enzyme [Planctomycetes bacterium]|nr:SUMF1/EgtB/PvdO family nonheme iron enzyme [Planctomycetota bacterium]
MGEEEKPGGSADNTSRPPSDQTARLANLILTSGLASKSDVMACVNAWEKVKALGVQHSLVQVMMDKGIITANQARAVTEASESGDKHGLLGGYLLMEKLGEGGMGTVFKAKQVSLGRYVALKILPDDMAKDEQFLARFEREARIAASIHHPNIVGAIDSGIAAGKRYFAMELVEGESVKDILDREGKIPPTRSLEIIIQIARALEAAWRSNLIHRDIKPDNILIDKSGVAKLADLGLAKETTDNEVTSLTMTGLAVGTPNYVSPEQATADKTDIRTDIYSLGATFYHMVTGRMPFAGENPQEVILARFKQMPKLANELNREVPRSMAIVIDNMMAIRADDRYPDPRVLLHDLLLVSEGHQPEYASGSEASRKRAVATARDMRGDTGVRLRPVKQHTVLSKGIAAGFIILVVAAGVAIGTGISRYYFKRSGAPTVSFTDAGSRVSTKDLAAALEELNGLITAGEYDQAVARADLLAVKFVGVDGAEQLDELKKSAASARAELLDAEVGKAISRTRALIAERSYSDAVSFATENLARYRGAPMAAELDTLRMQALRAQDEQARQKAETEEKDRKYRSLVDEARLQIEAREFMTAVSLLTQARSLKPTDEVASLLNDTRFAQFMLKARDAEQKGALAEAVAMYSSASEIRPSDDLTARLNDLNNRLALQKLHSRALEFAETGKWQDALDAMADLREADPNFDKTRIDALFAKCSSELEYQKVVASASQAASDGKWRDALNFADDALRLRPGDAAATDMKSRARIELGPEARIVNSIGMEFVLVPAGEFVMGYNRGDRDERPAHKVSLDAFYIAVCEVTNLQFEEFAPAHRGKWNKYSPDDNMPAIAVTWHEAVAFCKWLTAREGVEYRLPTEAEWEKAARGSDGRLFPWGDNSPRPGRKPCYCNYAHGKSQSAWNADGYTYVSPVGTFSEGDSPFGCHDMLGNVWEWCLDWHAPYDVARGVVPQNPAGPPEGKEKVMRGGSFSNTVDILRCSNRVAQTPSVYDANVGFRCVRLLPEKLRSATAPAKDQP